MSADVIFVLVWRIRTTMKVSENERHRELERERERKEERK